MSAEQNLSPRRPIASFLLRSILGILIVFLVSQQAKADTLEDAARALARRVAAILRGGSVTCEMQNGSSLGTAEFANVSSAFQDELQRHGIKVVTSEAGVSISMTVTQSPTEYIGVAQIVRKENPQTLLETLGPVTGPADPAPTFNLELHRVLLFSRDAPTLDVVFESNSTSALVLGPHEIDTYEVRDGHWSFVRSDRLLRHRTPGRNERGMLGIGIDAASAWFPEEVCNASALPGSKGWSCEKNNRQVPIRFVPDEAWAGKKTGPWFSAALFEVRTKPALVVTGQDGLARLYEDGNEPVATFSGWGGEIAGVRGGCGSDSQLLVTGSRDWTAADTVQVVEIRDRRAVTVSAPMEFPGPIIALHTPGTRGVDPSQPSAQALAVDRNLQTGEYEAYLLTVTCAH